jgi:hypothetical protein
MPFRAVFDLGCAKAGRKEVTEHPLHGTLVDVTGSVRRGAHRRRGAAAPDRAGQDEVESPAADARLRAPGPGFPAVALTVLQRRAGNQAVSGLVSVRRDTTPTTTPGGITISRQANPVDFEDDPLAAGGFSDADAPLRVRPGPVRTTLIRPSTSVVAGQSRMIGTPAAVLNVTVPASQLPGGSESDARLGVDVAADARTVTVTFIARNVSFRDAGEAGTFDWLHEPNVAIQVTPGNAPQPVVQAAIAAMNAHLRRRGRDLVELSVSPQVGVGQSGVSAGVQGQAEIHVTESFSFTASSTVSVGPHGGAPDPSQVRLGGNALVDLNWQPMSIGVLYHLDASRPTRPSGLPVDYGAVQRDAKLIGWVVGQLDRSWFNTPGNDDFDVSEVVTRLLDAMRAAGGERAELELHFGLMPIPTGFRTGMERAAQLIAGTSPTFSSLSNVRVTIFGLRPDNTETVIRYTNLYLGRSGVIPAGTGSGP